MNPVLWAILVSILIIAVVLQLDRLRRKTTEELRRVLLKDNDLKLYLQLLENRHLHLLFSKATLEHFRLEGYLLENDSDAVAASIARLDQAHLSRGERLDYDGEKLSWYCRRHETEQAEAVVKDMRSLLADSKNEKDQAILNDAELIERIYIKQDTSVIPELKRLAESQNGSMRAITCFRIAKLYHFKQMDDQSAAYLKKAEGPAKGTGAETMIRECRNDLSKLDVY